MADRTFPNDPHPPAKLAPAREGGYTPSSSGGGAVVAAKDVQIQKAKTPARLESDGPVPRDFAPKVQYSVIPDEDGNSSTVFATDEAGVDTEIGRIKVADHKEVLDATSRFNPVMQGWDGVPEETALTLLSGRLAPLDFIKAKFRQGESTVVGGMLWSKWLRKEVDLDEVTAKSNPALLDHQLKNEPSLPWSSGFWGILKDAIKRPGETARMAVGETVQMAPYSLGTAAAGLAGTAGGTAIGEVGSVLLSPAAIANPLVVAEFAALASTYSKFKFVMDVEAGNAARAMMEKGFQEETVRKWAPGVGVMNGALEMLQFDLLTAPLRRAVATQVLQAKPVKKALSKWLFNYAKEVTGEAVIEVTQDQVETLINNFAAGLEQNPKLLEEWDDNKGKYWETFFKTLMGAGGSQAVTTAGEHLLYRKAAAGEKANAEKVGAAAEKRLKEAAAAGEKKAAEVKPPKELPADGGKKSKIEEAPPVEAPLAQAVKDIDEGKVPPEKIAETVEKALDEEEAAAPKTQAQADKLAEKVRKEQVKGRVAELESKLADEMEVLRALHNEQKRYLKNEMSTKVLDKELEERMARIDTLKSEIDGYTNPDVPEMDVTDEEDIRVRPATLADIASLGFTEGRKEVLKTRIAAIDEIARAHELTYADVRKILGRKNYGMLGDVAFANYLEEFEDRAIASGVRKKMEAEVRGILKEKQLKREANIRALYKLPAVGKMTKEQLGHYANILRGGDTVFYATPEGDVAARPRPGYQKGDVALSKKFIESLAGGPYAGARTTREIIAAGAQIAGVDLEAMKLSKAGEFDLLKYDTALARTNALYNAVVRVIKTALYGAARRTQETEAVMFKLGAAALKSRERTLVERAVPTMPEVMAWLEAEAGDAKTAAEKELTPEELQFGAFFRAIMDARAEYHGIEGRFTMADSYAPHTARGVLEILKDEKGNRAQALIKEIAAAAAGLDVFAPEDVKTRGFGYTKFFGNLERRTGALTPTKNLLRAGMKYLKSSYEKEALDKASSVALVLVKAINATNEAEYPGSKEDGAALLRFVEKYIAGKRGGAEITDIIPIGGKLDTILRLAVRMTSLLRIAGNVAMQVASPVGENMVLIPALRSKLVTANVERMYSDKGNRILAKYQYFTGKGALAELLEPGKGVEAIPNFVLYGFLRWHKTRAMQTILLAGMTDAEYEAETISDDRLAEIALWAGRYVDLHGAKSYVGSTSIGSGVTQFKSWAIPTLNTIATDLGPKVAKNLLRVEGPGGKLTKEEVGEVYALLLTGAVVAAGLQVIEPPDERDFSLQARLRRKVSSELLSNFTPLNPRLYLGFPSAAEFATFIDNVWLLLTWQKYADSDDLKAVEGFKRQMPAVFGQMRTRRDEEQ